MNNKQIINSLPSGTVLHGKAYSYVIEKALGQGAFGITYLAKVQMQGALGSLDTEARVAIKEFFMKEVNGREGCTVTASANTGIFVDYKKKFRAEAEHLAALKHRNIINVVESFEANNTVYYVMEYIDGGSLDDYISEYGKLPEDMVRNYVAQIGGALQLMHQRKMLHLDLKPANIMRRKDGILVLIDFGLSKQFDENGEPESTTSIGGGTPGYAPIEQMNYQRGDGFPATMDVYALGATAFKMLVGKRAPEAAVILNDGFPFNTFTGLSVSQSLINVIAKAMAPKRIDRFQSVDELLETLGDSSSSNNDENGEKTLSSNEGKNGKEHFDSTEETGEDVTDTVLRQPKNNGNRSDSRGSSPKPDPNVKRYLLILAGIVIISLLGYGAYWLGQRGPDTHDSEEIGADTIDTNGHECVDLGLSVKWATCNVGATSPEEYGDYFAWGETSPKSTYSWKNLKYRISGDSYDNVKFSKYVGRSKHGTVDNKTTLDLSDDAAHVNWRGSWRMPTKAEQDELRENCNWTWTTMNGKNGYKVTSKRNGNSIFLPAAGYRDNSGLSYVGWNGFYWSSSLYPSYSSYACHLDFYSGNVEWCSYSRYYGHSVRPVCP